MFICMDTEVLILNDIIVFKGCSGKPVYLNKNHIIRFGATEKHGYYREEVFSVIHLSSGDKILVYETPEQIYKLLKENEQ